ncbi:MAG: dihydroorotate dehydrogenase-like protein [Planctomycetes bacterium]|jgi:dihydroorotate dehydrogenase (fumarate)|nr:dihydroorotate dehydrogenase-like protein [Planctomycetota bacterium]
MDLTTKYLGLTLPHPVVPSASQPLSKDLASLKRLEDNGAAAVILHSLFEEQIRLEADSLEHFLEQGSQSFAEALTYFPAPESYMHGPEEYLELVRQAKEVLSIPVIGSLNGISTGGWTEYARKIEQAGADAIELNIYYVATNPKLSSADVEQVYVDVLREVKSRVKIPVSVKMGPYVTALVHFAKRLEAAGADGLSLFNRFYQPDIDIEALEVAHELHLSTSAEMLLPLRWMAILRPHLTISLGATTGVHTPADALKLLMAGADVVHLCAAILKNGAPRIKEVRDGIAAWLTSHEYDSLNQARGSMSQASCPEPGAFERANYMKVVHSYRRR